MKNKILISIVLVSFSAMSFVKHPTSTKTIAVAGICGVSESYSHLKLILNKDQTFQYINTVNPKKSINVKGNWELKGNTISLKNYTSEYAINTKWKIDKNCGCLKSRKGMEFTRICPITKK